MIIFMSVMIFLILMQVLMIDFLSFNSTYENINLHTLKKLQGKL